MGYLSDDENYYLSYDVIRLSKEDYIKLLVAMTGPEMKITDLKFKDLEKNYSELFNTLMKQRKDLAFPNDHPFEESAFISWQQIIRRANEIKEKLR